MAKNKKNQMTDKQFEKAIDDLKSLRPVVRGGRPTIYIENKRKEADKYSCRKFQS